MTSKIRTLIVALALGAASVGAVAGPALAQDRGFDHGDRDWHRDGHRGGWYDRWHHFHPVPIYAAPAYPAYYPPPVVYAAPRPYAYAPPVASLNFVLPLRIR